MPMAVQAMAVQAMAAQAMAGQANVMLRQGERQLRPALFRGMAADDAGSLSMREAEPQRRSADDLRRAAQMAAACGRPKTIVSFWGIAGWLSSTRGRRACSPCRM